jgi:hypothetical protein
VENRKSQIHRGKDDIKPEGRLTGPVNPSASFPGRPALFHKPCIDGCFACLAEKHLILHCMPGSCTIRCKELHRKSSAFPELEEVLECATIPRVSAQLIRDEGSRRFGPMMLRVGANLGGWEESRSSMLCRPGLDESHPGRLLAYSRQLQYNPSCLFAIASIP